MNIQIYLHQKNDTNMIGTNIRTGKYLNIFEYPNIRHTLFETNSFKIVSKLFANFVKELELRIWGSSLTIEQQNLKSEPVIPTNGDDIQKKLWELIKP